MMKNISFYKAIEILHNGGTIVHANGNILTEFKKWENSLVDINNEKHIYSFSYLKPDDKYMTYEDKKKNIDFVGIEFAYEGEDKTEMIWLEKNLLEKIKQKTGIDLPEIIEKIIEK